MAAGVRALLTLFFIANARCGLLPLDLSGVSPGDLLHLGLDTPSGGLLGSLGSIVSSGVGTLGSLGSGVLGKLTALNDKDVDPNAPVIYLKPWNVDSSYTEYMKDLLQGARDGRAPISYSDWINMIHGDYNRNLSKESATEKPTDGKTDKPIKNDDKNKGITVNLDNKDGEDKDDQKTTANNDFDDTIHFPDSAEVIKKGKGKNILQKPIITTTPASNGYGNQIIVLPPSNQQNGGYVPNTGSNVGYQVTQAPTIYSDDQGHLYYLQQPNPKPVDQPVTNPPSSDNQGYALMNINGQYVLIPIASLANVLQYQTTTTPAPSYVFVPNVQTTKHPVHYETTPNYNIPKHVDSNQSDAGKGQGNDRDENTKPALKITQGDIRK